jgi:predicted enzyme related to lactoylglutathione lyase
MFAYPDKLHGSFRSYIPDFLGKACIHAEPPPLQPAALCAMRSSLVECASASSPIFAALGGMPQLLVNLDVNDIERAVSFYTEGLQLHVGRRFDDGFVELLGADAPIYLLGKATGSKPFEGAASGREYSRHWTPVHLDFVVQDLDAAIARAVTAGATLESPARQEAYGRLAMLSDPFGHGFWLLQFQRRGYDELLP